MRFTHYFLVPVAVILSIASCGKKKKGEGTGSVSATSKVSAQTFLAQTTAPTTNAPNTPTTNTSTTTTSTTSAQKNTRTSINPSAYKVKFDFILLCKDALAAHTGSDGVGYTCDSGGIGLKGDGSETDMIGKDANQAAASFKNDDLGEDQFGSYKGAVVYFSDELKMSGETTIEGHAYSFTDGLFGIGFKYSPVEFPESVKIDESNEGNVRMFFDTEALAYVAHAYLGGGNSGIVLADKLYARGSYPTIIPYAGNGEAQMEVYDLTFDTDKLGTRNLYKLKVTIVKGADGSFYAAGWRPIYLSGYTDTNIEFDPCPLYNPYTVVTGDSYKLVSRSPSSSCGNQLTLNAFQIKNHTGTATYFSKDEPTPADYNYTAVKR